MKAFSVKSEISPSDGATAITIEGALTLANGYALRNSLLEILPQDGDVHIVVREVDDIDLSGLQLLVALKKRQLRRGKKVSFEVALPTELREMAVHSGFTF